MIFHVLTRLGRRLAGAARGVPIPAATGAAARFGRSLDRMMTALDMYKGVGKDDPETSERAYAGHAGRRMFVLGILLCGLVLSIVTVAGALAEVFNRDTRALVALLPLLYAPLLLGGVGWLVWASSPARRKR